MKYKIHFLYIDVDGFKDTVIREFDGKERPDLKDLQIGEQVEMSDYGIDKKDISMIDFFGADPENDLTTVYIHHIEKTKEPKKVKETENVPE